MNKKVISLALSSIIMLSSTTGLAAATTGNVYKLDGSLFATGNEMNASSIKRNQVNGQESKLLYGFNGKYYSMANAQEAFLEANGDMGVFASKIVLKDEVVIGVEGELKVVEVSAINNTSIVVNFDRDIEGTLKASDFTFNNSLRASSVDTLSGKRSVRVTTTEQVAGRNYSLDFKGQATGKSFTGKGKVVENEYKILRAEAKSNTSVYIELDNAPLNNLIKEDFVISPNLEIKSVNTVNHTVTLTTAPQKSGTEYTVTAIGTTGSGFAIFDGKAAVSQDMAIENVEVQNLRQLRIDFKEPIKASSVVMDNIYLGMLDKDDTIANVQSKSLKELLGTTNWEISFGDQKTFKADAVVNYAIIQSKGGVTVAPLITDAIDKDVATGGLGLELDKMATVEVRNLKRDYINTSQFEFRVSDKEAPYVANYTKVAEFGRLHKQINANDPTNSITAYKNFGATTTAVAIDPAKAYLEVIFNEPLDTRDLTDLEIKIDGVVVSTEFIGKLTNIGTVAEESSLLFDVSGQRVGNHKLTIAKAEDLNDNLQGENIIELDFEIKDEVKDVVTHEKPVVRMMDQVADNVLVFEYDQKGVTIPDGSTLELEHKVGSTTVNTTVTIDNATNTHIEAIKDKDGKTIGTRAYVQFIDEGALGSEKDDVIAFYNAAKDLQVRVNAVLKGHISGTIEGDTYRKAFTLNRDNLAPRIESNKLIADKANGIIYVPFTDKPFNSPNGDIAAAIGGKVTITRTYKGNDEVGTVTLASADVVTGIVATGNAQGETINRYVKLDLTTLANLVTTTDLDLVEGATYKVEFAEGSVTDADETYEGLEFINAVDNAIGKGQKGSITIGTTADQEGRVPQTKRSLIFTNKATPTGILAGAEVLDTMKVAAVGDANKILVIFDGEAERTSATNPKNYTLDGKALPTGTVLEYNEEVLSDSPLIASIDGTAGDKTAHVIITLPSNTIKRTTTFDFTVEGVTNKEGKKMLPVTNARVELNDDTGALLERVEIDSTTQISLVFDETLEDNISTDEANIIENIILTIDGSPISIDKLKVDGNRLIVTVGNRAIKDVDTAKVTVEIKNDVNGKMFILDEATLANQAQEVKVTNK